MSGPDGLAAMCGWLLAAELVAVVGVVTTPSRSEIGAVSTGRIDDFASLLGTFGSVPPRQPAKYATSATAAQRMVAWCMPTVDARVVRGACVTAGL